MACCLGSANIADIDIDVDEEPSVTDDHGCNNIKAAAVLTPAPSSLSEPCTAQTIESQQTVQTVESAIRTDAPALPPALLPYGAPVSISQQPTEVFIGRGNACRGSPVADKNRHGYNHQEQGPLEKALDRVSVSEPEKEIVRLTLTSQPAKPGKTHQLGISEIKDAKYWAGERRDPKTKVRHKVHD